MTVSRVFVSYSHQDKQYLERMMVHLRPLIRGGINVWSDVDIKMGEKWKEKIEVALAEADAAILLVSADFLASEFIANNELPPLLRRAEQDGTGIFPVILKPCGFSRSELAQFQAVNDPNIPLARHAHAGREAVWEKLASGIAERTMSPSKQVSAVTPPTDRIHLDLSNEIEAQVVGRAEFYDWFRDELAKPTDISHYYWIYEYTYVDTVGLYVHPDSAFALHPWGSQLVQEVKHVLGRAMWNGQGTLMLFWIPPFLDTTGNGWGIWVWHVRDDDGNSWIASPRELRGNWNEVHKPILPPANDGDVTF